EFGCGIHNYIFESIDGYALGRIELEIREALDRWEPRVEVLDVDVDLSRAGDGVLLIDITYALLATNDVRNLVYPFYAIPAEPEGDFQRSRSTTAPSRTWSTRRVSASVSVARSGASTTSRIPASR